MIRSGVCFIVVALLVAELFGILVCAGWMTGGVTLWTQSGVTSQKMEYLRRLFLCGAETLYSCCGQHRVS